MTTTTRWILGAVGTLASLVAACQDAGSRPQLDIQPEEDTSTPPATDTESGSGDDAGGTAGGTVASASEGSGGASGGSAGMTDGPVTATGGGETASGSGTASAGTVGTSGGGNDACRKVDVVFAVDNSGSMQEEIADLKGPVFDSLPSQLMAVGNGIDDFHLAVIDGCPKPAAFHTFGDPGSGAVDCGFSTGASYMTSTSDALLTEYACVMNLTTAGYENMPDACVDAGIFDDDNEQPALAAADAVTSPRLEGENAGFLRDHAILFVVAMTDEDEELLADDGSDIVPNDIAQKLVAAKGGDLKKVVFLGIGGGSNCTGPYGTALDASALREVAGIFAAEERGLFWDLCQGNLEAAFDAAIAFVDDACLEITPQ